MNDITPEVGREPPHPDRSNIVSATGDVASRVVAQLSDPRSFLLFILAIIAVIEYASYLRTNAQSQTMLTILTQSATTLSHEQEINKATFATLLEMIDKMTRLNAEGLRLVLEESQKRREWEQQLVKGADKLQPPQP